MTNGDAFPGTPPDRLPHAVQAMADALIHPGHGISLRQMRRALEGLNGERQDALAILLARAWTATQGADAVVTKHHCLALINVMAVDAAERLIPTGRQLALSADALADPEARAQVAEFSGLQGRICNSASCRLMTTPCSTWRRATTTTSTGRARPWRTGMASTWWPC